MDSLSPEQRSRIMAAIRSKGNKSTEQALRYRLVRAGIRGWHMLDPTLTGTPDFIFPSKRLVVFVDGCYWHGCPECYRAPKTNRKFWSEKIVRNRARDIFVGTELKSQGWSVMRVWEHELKHSPEAVLTKLQNLIRRPTRAFSATAGKP